MKKERLHHDGTVSGTPEKVNMTKLGGTRAELERAVAPMMEPDRRLHWFRRKDDKLESHIERATYTSTGRFLPVEPTLIPYVKGTG